MKAPSITDHFKLTWGGFLAAETVYRTRNEVADMGSSFQRDPVSVLAAIRRARVPRQRASEPNFAARGTQHWPGENQKLAGYYEMDFNGVGATSNCNQTNGWGPRLRQANFTYDNKDWGLHFLGGQAWSLLTQNTAGITPRKENVPLTIDGDVLSGFQLHA